ncbi:MAG: outer membrane protein transport protein [Candidatus Competibacteraceae bacterium]
MQAMSFNRLPSVAVVISIMCYAGATQAGGFQVTELCGKCQGTRNAGAAATADTAATVFFNPAGLARLKGNTVEATAHVISSKFNFKDGDSTNAIGGQPIGARNEDGGGVVPVPNLFYAQELNEPG